jgi:hypothetical protein
VPACSMTMFNNIKHVLAYSSFPCERLSCCCLGAVGGDRCSPADSIHTMIILWQATQYRTNTHQNLRFCFE